MREWKIMAATMLAAGHLMSGCQPWTAANDRKAPKRKPKNRDKVKAARKQRNRK